MHFVKWIYWALAYAVFELCFLVFQFSFWTFLSLNLSHCCNSVITLTYGVIIFFMSSFFLNWWGLISSTVCLVINGTLIKYSSNVQGISISLKKICMFILRFSEKIVKKKMIIGYGRVLVASSLQLTPNIMQFP